MGKPTRSRKPESYGKGKVTPVQIAFIVDRYLSDNNYSQSRSTFRNEASDLISKSPVQEAPKSLLSLGAILDEYIHLKEQKLMMDQEKCRLEQEKFRVQALLRGMQDVMNAYNAGGSAVPPPPPPMISSLAAKSAAVVPQMDLATPAGYPVYNTTPVMMPASRPSNTQMDPSNFSTPTTNHQAAKRRKGSKDVPDAPINVKRSRSQPNTNQLPVKSTSNLSQSSNAVMNNQGNAPQFSAGQSSHRDNLPNGSPVQGSSVAKCLFNQANQSPPTNLTVPKTPLQATSSQSDKSVSPLETSSTATSTNDVSPQQNTSTNCIVISSETIRVSPVKQVTCLSIERNYCMSSSPVKANLKRINKRDHVKGRLDFDGSDSLLIPGRPITDGISASEPDKDKEFFDLDLPSLDGLGMDFSLGELLVDFDLVGDFSCQPVVDYSPKSHSGSPNQPWHVDLGENQVLSELSSTMTEIISEKDMNVKGPESVTSVKSTTKCITILSPVKNHTSSSLDRENLCTKN